MRTIFLCSWLWAGTGAAAIAAPLTVRVVDAGGRPVRDAVVTIRPSAGAQRPAGGALSYTVKQKDMQFRPFVSVVPVGATVSFPNLDSSKHHVYSFSPAKRFELKLFARDQSRSVRFDKPGMIALGCNIHDAMSAFIIVTDSTWTAVTDAKGTVRFTDLPDSSAAMTLWHPYLRTPDNQLVRTLARGKSAELVAVRLRPAPMHNMGGY